MIVAAGRLIRQGPMADVLNALPSSALVQARSPEPEKLTAALRALGATVTTDGTGSLRVSGATAATIGDTALATGVALHQLHTQQPDLEDVFLELTQGKAGIR